MNNKQTINQNFEAIVSQKMKFDFQKIISRAKEMKGILIPLGIILILFIIILILSRFALPRKMVNKTPLIPTPTPIEQTSRNLSSYATDSAILQTSSILNEIEKDLKATDLDEAGLNPPVLNWQIRIE